MPPIQYLNAYVIMVLGSLGATIFGAVYCYSGMSQVSFMTYQGMNVTTYYYDKGKYDLYVNGLIYSGVFAVAILLILFVILIPSPQQLQRRMSASPFGGPMGGPMGGPQGTMPAPNMQQPMEPIDEAAELGFELTPDVDLSPQLEDYGEGFSMDALDADDSDVVNGKGRITDESHENFLRQHPDSAVKFLLRKDLSGAPVSADQEEAFEEWQKRGLSRGKLRQHLFNLMDWDDMPDLSPQELVSELQSKL